jgi:hypothetical protein
VQFVGRIMRVVDQNDPNSPRNRGVVVFHAGANVASRWEDFQRYSQADQEFFDQFLPVEVLDFGAGNETEIEPQPRDILDGMEVRGQTGVQMQEIPLLHDQDAIEALRVLQGRATLLRNRSGIPSVRSMMSCPMLAGMSLFKSRRVLSYWREATEDLHRPSPQSTMVFLYDNNACVRGLPVPCRVQSSLCDLKIGMDHSYGRDNVLTAICTLVGKSEATGLALMRRSQHFAAESRALGGHDATDNDGFVAETFTLPLDAARRKVRDIFDHVPQRRCSEIVEHWRQLPDGKIEFTMRRILTSN